MMFSLIALKEIDGYRGLVLISVGTLLFLCIIIIILFIIFQKRKNILLLEQKESEKRFEQEIGKTQIEIREETFRNISWELHDNIGQLITLAKIQLQNGDTTEAVLETLNKGLKEVRTLSKAINPEALKNISLVTAVEQEINRFNRIQYIDARLELKGEEKTLNPEVRIVFFRILQEFFSNTIKHAKATKLCVTIDYRETSIDITAKDNGKGFDKENIVNAGIGLTNICKRAQLINAESTIDSVVGEGTSIHVHYVY